MSSRRFLPLVLSVQLAIVLAQSARTQCASTWQPGFGLPGADSFVLKSTLWDPDGAGPQAAVAVILGDFTSIGRVRAHQLATYDPSTGTIGTLPFPGAGAFRAVAGSATGALIAVERPPTPSYPRALTWDGASWTQLGGTFDRDPSAVVCLPNGDVVVGGPFGVVGNTAVGGLARWDGAAWQSLGTDLGTRVEDLAVTPSGELIAVGTIRVGGVTSCVGRFDGSRWWLPGNGVPGTGISVALGRSSELYVVRGGLPTLDLIRVDGLAWSQVAPRPASGSFRRVCALSSGDVILGGSFTSVGGVSCESIARLDSTGWHGLGTGIRRTARVISQGLSPVWSLLELPGGDLLVGGEFVDAGGVVALNLARFGPAGWTPVTPGTLGDVFAMAADPSGRVVVGGNFVSIADVTASKVALWDGTAWQALGAGLTLSSSTDPFAAEVVDVAFTPSGDVVAVGSFDRAGGRPVSNIARWNGTSWSAVGPPLPGLGVAYDVQALPDGRVLVSGADTVTFAPVFAAWDGVVWTSLAIGPLQRAFVTASTLRHDGTPVVAFTSGSGFDIAVESGAGWRALGAQADGGIDSLLTLADGRLVAAGRFRSIGGTAGNIAVWNGSAWTGIGTSILTEAHWVGELPDRSLVAVGPLSSGLPGVVRWDGAAWREFGLASASRYTSSRTSVGAVSAPGELFVGGSFDVAFAGRRAAGLARWGTSCPGRFELSTSAVGCPDSSGVVPVLTVDRAPWAGVDVEFGIAPARPGAPFWLLLGFGANTVSLAGIGAPGCAVHVLDPVALLASSSGGAAATARLPLPANPVLHGVGFHAQAIVFDPLANGLGLVLSARGDARIGGYP